MRTDGLDDALGDAVDELRVPVAVAHNLARLLEARHLPHHAGVADSTDQQARRLS